MSSITAVRDDRAASDEQSEETLRGALALHETEPNKRLCSVCASLRCMCVLWLYVCKHTDVTVSQLRRRRVALKTPPECVDSKKQESREETGQRASKSYKHWSGRGSGEGLEEQPLNIQRQK